MRWCRLRHWGQRAQPCCELSPAAWGARLGSVSREHPFPALAMFLPAFHAHLRSRVPAPAECSPLDKSATRSFAPMSEPPVSSGATAAVALPDVEAACGVAVPAGISPRSSSLSAALGSVCHARVGFPSLSFLLRATGGAASWPHPAEAAAPSPPAAPALPVPSILALAKRPSCSTLA